MQAVLSPASASPKAARSPAPPAPTTMASYCKREDEHRTRESLAGRDGGKAHLVLNERVLARDGSLQESKGDRVSFPSRVGSKNRRGDQSKIGDSALRVDGPLQGLTGTSLALTGEVETMRSRREVEEMERKAEVEGSKGWRWARASEREVEVQGQRWIGSAGAAGMERTGCSGSS